MAPNVAPDSPVNTVVQLAGVAGIGGWVLAASSDEPDTGRSILRWSPLVLAAAAVDVAAKNTPGFGPYWLDGLLAAGWAAASYLVMRPPGTPAEATGQPSALPSRS